ADWGGSPVSAYTGDLDIFVTKLNSSGAQQWHTFLGSSDADHGNDIAVDSSGNIYVTGDSEINWGTPLNAHAGGQGGADYADALIAKLNSSGVLQWHTFMGSTSYEVSNAIILDGSMNIYITGESYVSWGSPVNPHAGNCEAFVAKLNSSGTPQWHTFMGSTSYDYGNGIALDGSGNVYVAGRSGATWGSPMNAYAGGQDAFAAKLNNNGVLQWNTFMGSASTDYGNDVDVDESRNVYVTGHSNATWGSPTIAYAGNFDAFIAQLDNSGVLKRHSFIGASIVDFGMAITVDSSGNAYVTGESDATWGGSPVSAHSGWMDAFVAKFLMPSQAKTLAPVFLLLLE
ncbi:MAG: SBBP repeat-containing protein, partial [Desulfobacteraceae bacterium]|nr:SBBP repeat-containing protein [Desulfobacteraceae bacterium]